MSGVTSLHHTSIYTMHEIRDSQHSVDGDPRFADCFLAEWRNPNHDR